MQNKFSQQSVTVIFSRGINVHPAIDGGGWRLTSLKPEQPLPHATIVLSTGDTLALPEFDSADKSDLILNPDPRLQYQNAPNKRRRPSSHANGFKPSQYRICAQTAHRWPSLAQ